LLVDADHNMLAQAEYAPGAVPSIYLPKPETAYIIVESHRLTPNAAERVTRSIYNREDEPGTPFSTLSAGANGTFVHHTTQIRW